MTTKLGRKKMLTKSYKAILKKQLQDIDFSAGYLSECLKQGDAAFLIGLRDVVEVHGGIGKLAKLTELNREGLYRLLSEDGNPKLSSLIVILDNIGIDLNFKKKRA